MVYLKISKDNRWNVRVVRQLFRVKGDSPRETAEKHLATGAPIARAHSREIVPRKAILYRVVSEFSCPRIETGYPLVGTHPEIAPVISEYATHDVAGQSIFLVESRKAHRFWIHLIQSGVCPGPQPAPTIFKNCGNRVVT